LSRNAAEIFFASLVEAEKAGALEEDIFVLELGIGVGLFARFFLDHFKELCRKNKQDYYDRLCYVAADRSERMLLDFLRHGVLSHHLGRFCVHYVDALKPEETLPKCGRFRRQQDRPFRAVFLNYLLDCLPAAVLEIDGDTVKELCVRTCVARNVRLADFTDMSIEQLRDRAASSDPGSRQELLEVYGLFASEYDYQPTTLKKAPYGEFAHRYCEGKAKRLLVNFGAMQCLTKLIDLVHEQGFILMNEYGTSKRSLDDDFEHQRFSYATAVGLNFPMLQTYLTQDSTTQMLEPDGDEERGIHTRLLSRQPAAERDARFKDVFGKASFEKLEEPIRKARSCVQYGRFELAASYYQQALALQPRNWVLMSEISAFLTFQLRNPKEAIDMVKVALSLNPTCSAELWNSLGDALYEWGRPAEAKTAYLRAASVNENDVRSRYNLAWACVRLRDFESALEAIAKALVLDKLGQYRDRILQKQSEILAHMALRNQQEYLMLINLVSRSAKPQESKADHTPLAPRPDLQHSTDILPNLNPLGHDDAHESD
jgi:tetratricopeptide (TPR) repeat protein